jgi:hypothetical protein
VSLPPSPQSFVVGAGTVDDVVHVVAEDRVGVEAAIDVEDAADAVVAGGRALGVAEVAVEVVDPQVDEDGGAGVREAHLRATDAAAMVAPGHAEDQIVAGAADQRVVAEAPRDVIVAGAALHHVVVVAAVDEIIAVAPIQVVVSSRTGDVVIASSAENKVVAGLGVDVVLVGDADVRIVPADQRVIAGGAVHVDVGVEADAVRSVPGLGRVELGGHGSSPSLAGGRAPPDLSGRSRHRTPSARRPCEAEPHISPPHFQRAPDGTLKRGQRQALSSRPSNERHQGPIQHTLNLGPRFSANPTRCLYSPLGSACLSLRA